MVRLKSLNNLLSSEGLDPTIYEDFVYETFSLLERTRAELPSLDAGQMLLSSFNDRDIAPAIITHFRVSLPLSTLQIEHYLERPDKAPAYHELLDEEKCTALSEFSSRQHRRTVLSKQNRSTSGRDREHWHSSNSRRGHQTCWHQLGSDLFRSEYRCERRGQHNILARGYRIYHNTDDSAVV